MPGQDNHAQGESVDAIRSVLAAEAQVRRKVETCRAELSAALNAEQARARNIEHRTSERLNRLHTRCEQRLEELAAERRATASAEAPHVAPDAADRKVLQAAVDELAARLTGAADG